MNRGKHVYLISRLFYCLHIFLMHLVTASESLGYYQKNMNSMTVFDILRHGLISSGGPRPPWPPLATSLDVLGFHESCPRASS